MTDRTFVLRNLSILVYDQSQDAMIESGVTFSYKSNLFALLRNVPEGKTKKGIKDVLQVEDFIQRVISTKSGEAIVLKDSEYILLKGILEDHQYGVSSPELKQLYLDVCNAPEVIFSGVVEK